MNKVLVLTKEPELRGFLATLLAEKGYLLTAPEKMRNLKPKAFDLLVLDLDTVEESDHGYLSDVLPTVTLGEGALGLSSGTKKHLVKPVEPQQILDALHILGKSSKGSWLLVVLVVLGLCGASVYYMYDIWVTEQMLVRKGELPKRVRPRGGALLSGAGIAERPTPEPTSPEDGTKVSPGSDLIQDGDRPNLRVVDVFCKDGHIWVAYENVGGNGPAPKFTIAIASNQGMGAGGPMSGVFVPPPGEIRQVAVLKPEKVKATVGKRIAFGVTLDRSRSVRESNKSDNEVSLAFEVGKPGSHSSELRLVDVPETPKNFSGTDLFTKSFRLLDDGRVELEIFNQGDAQPDAELEARMSTGGDYGGTVRRNDVWVKYRVPPALTSTRVISDVTGFQHGWDIRVDLNKGKNGPKVSTHQSHWTIGREFDDGSEPYEFLPQSQ